MDPQDTAGRHLRTIHEGRSRSPVPGQDSFFFFLVMPGLSVQPSASTWIGLLTDQFLLDSELGYGRNGSVCPLPRAFIPPEQPQGMPEIIQPRPSIA